MRVCKIKELIEAANAGEILLPDFQREFDYERSKQKGLFISLFSGIPLGSVLTLRGEENDFGSRNIGRKSNVHARPGRKEVTFLLDGQQRMTSLWNGLSDVYSGHEAKGKVYDELHNYLKSRWFIKFKLDENFANDVWGYEYLESDLNIIGDIVPEDLEDFVFDDQRIIGFFGLENGLEYPVDDPSMNSKAKDYRKFIEKNLCVPMHLIFEKQLIRPFLKKIARSRCSEIEGKIFEWKEAEISFDDLSIDQRALLKCGNIRASAGWLSFEKGGVAESIRDRADGWVDNILDYFHIVSETSIGVVELDKSYLKKAHVVFDVINKTGKKLSAFDLFCASKPGLNVRAEVDKRVPNQIGLKANDTDLISDAFTDQFMNLIRIVYAHEREEFSQGVLKEDHIFTMSSDEFESILPRLIDSLVQAYQFLHKKCGVAEISKMAYKLQVLPIAFGYFLKQGRAGGIERKLEYVYWLTMFSGHYRESQGLRCFKDLEMVRNGITPNGELEIPEFYGIGSEMWSKILNDPGYNDVDTLVPELQGKVDSRASVKKAITQFILSRNPVDFPPNQGSRLSSISHTEAHHILPLASASFNKITESTTKLKLRAQSDHYLNSALNFALISQDSNRKIAAMSYSDYSGHFSEEIYRQYCMPRIGFSTNSEEEQLLWLKERHGILRAKLHSTLEELHRS